MAADNPRSTKTQPDNEERSVTRRNFLGSTASVGVAAAAGLVAKQAGAKADPTNAKLPIRIPDELTQTRNEAAKPANFPMDGSQVFAKFCKDEGLAALFCCPGNYPVINAIAAEGIPTYGGRTEGAMCSAADAFSRVTGEIAACSGTEGPGFTNMIMNIGCANAARTPLLVLASNMTISGDDTERRIQQAYQQPTTEGLKKYGKRLIDPSRIYEYSAYAFRQLKTGVPRPVHLDFPGEVTRARFKEPGELQFYYDKTRYRTESRPHPAPADIRKAVEMIGKAQRPMIVASTGVFYARAWDALKATAEKNDIAVVESGSSRGHFSDGHPLSASTAPDALLSADLVILIGQYCMPSVGEFAFGPDVKYIRVDPDPADIGRNLPIDLGIVSCEKAALEALADQLPNRRRPEWVNELAKARKAFEFENEEYYQLGLKYSKDTQLLHPAVIAHDLADFLYAKNLPKEQTTIAMGGYGIARYIRRFARAFRPGQICNGAYQYGAIGPDVGYTFGTAVAVQNGIGPQKAYKGAPVIGVTGDAGFAYSGMELETFSKYKVPAVMILYNNNAWGVYTSGRSPRAMHMYLFQENLRYDKVAEGLGARGEYVSTSEDFRAALARSYKIAADQGVTTLINCQAKKEFWSNKDYPPGFVRNVEPGCMAYNH
jgi:thiamine pyrophosphate-dependent acetolactate synthase large subunit-like protein